MIFPLPSGERGEQWQQKMQPTHCQSFQFFPFINNTGLNKISL